MLCLALLSLVIVFVSYDQAVFSAVSTSGVKFGSLAVCVAQVFLGCHLYNHHVRSHLAPEHPNPCAITDSCLLVGPTY